MLWATSPKAIPNPPVGVRNLNAKLKKYLFRSLLTKKISSDSATGAKGQF